MLDDEICQYAMIRILQSEYTYAVPDMGVWNIVSTFTDRETPSHSDSSTELYRASDGTMPVSQN